MSGGIRALLPAACALAVLACARGPAPAAGGEPSAAVARDTLRGTLEVVGAEPGTQVALLDGNGGAVTLEGERAALLRLSGLEATVWGRRTDARTFAVARFAIRGANGVPAVDGVLRRTGAGWALETAEGARLPLARLPDDPALREGVRLWWAGPTDRPPDSFGIIAPAAPPG